MAEAAFKPEKDFSKEAEKTIPEAEQLAKVSRLPSTDKHLLRIANH